MPRVVGPWQSHRGIQAGRAPALDPVLRVADPAAGTEVIDTSGADNFIVAVVNTRQEGPSRRPGLCAGTADEVKACRDALAPPVVDMPDGGAPDGGAPDGDAGSTAPPPSDETAGCDCDVGRAATSSGESAICVISALAAAAGLRRRRAS